MKPTHTEIAGVLSATVLACVTLAVSSPCEVQPGCSADGYRIVSRRWDAVLKTNWELKQDCAHPEWPARLIATGSEPSKNAVVRPAELIPHSVQPLLVRAGEPVRLWMQDDRVRIEMNGVAEQSARAGERVLIRVMHQTGETGLTVEHIAGIVRGQASVEMER